MSNRPLIVINGDHFSDKNITGISRNAAEITRAMDKLLGERDRGVDVELLLPSANEPIPSYDHIEVRVSDKRCDSKVRRVLWRHIHFSNYVASRGGLGLDMTLTLPHRGRYCVFDYDAIPEDLPTQCFNSLRELKHWRYMMLVKYSLGGAEIVFTDSNYAKGRILHHYDLDPNKFVVVPCSWQHMLRIEQDDSILGRLALEPGQFFFSLGSRFPYKNFRWVEAAALQNPQYRFVVTGNAMHWEGDGKDAPANVTFTGYLSDGEVKALEAHCRAFLHPSCEEGFGIPPMEAMSAGARCIVSKAASLPEVYGDAVWYIDPAEYNNIDLDEIMSCSPKDSNEDVLLRYSWERSARIVLDAIEERCL